MSGLEKSLYALDWNNNIAGSSALLETNHRAKLRYFPVVIITLITYEYVLQFDKEVTFVWERQWSVMTYLYLVVRYFGIVLAMICAIWGECSRLTQIQPILYSTETSFAHREIQKGYDMLLFMQWGFSAYFCLAEVVLIWRLYVLYNQSKLILYILLGLFLPVIALYIAMDIFLWSRPSAMTVQEIIITPNMKYCTAFHHIGPMPAIYASIPIICYDILLVALAIAVLGKHLKERKELKMKPNTYVVMIVRYHVIYFVLNLTSQIIMVVLWAHLPIVVFNLVLLYKDTAPLIIVPRFIISIWDTHANDNCVHVSTTFEECVCWTSPPQSKQPEIDCSKSRKEVHTDP
ncbi:hypothetical protein BDR03DRAFT_1012819 [Suillus americanus]|nr:hypothetical protein BDR03DRAFT_1012819 [Suillus americanus]